MRGPAKLAVDPMTNEVYVADGWRFLYKGLGRPVRGAIPLTTLVP